jgi:hypothetical protein
MLAIGRMLLRFMPCTHAVEQIVDPGQLGDIMSGGHPESVKPNGAAGGEKAVNATTYQFVRTRVRTYMLMLNDT